MPHAVDTEAQTASNGYSISDYPDYPGIPAMPEGLPYAPIPYISLKKILANDDEEVKKLGEACETMGFVNLDMRGAKSVAATGDEINTDSVALPLGDPLVHKQSKHRINNADTPVVNGAEMLENVNKILDLMPAFFAEEEEYKKQFNHRAKGVTTGWKPFGDSYSDRKGTRDRNEMWDIGKDDLYGLREHLPAPKLAEDNLDLFKDYAKGCQALTCVVLNALEKFLGLDPNALSSIHKGNKLSNDKIRVVYAPPQDENVKLAVGPHADSGSVTILFNKVGGLQILPPKGFKGINTEEQEWMYVRPQPDHAIVNLGNAMAALTAGCLRSVMHRVNQPPGEQARLYRYSCAYFGRLEDDQLVTPLVGKGSKMIDEAAKERPLEGEPERFGEKYERFFKARRIPVNGEKPPDKNASITDEAMANLSLR